MLGQEKYVILIARLACAKVYSRVTFDGLLRNYGITPVEDPFIPMDPDLVSWTSKRLALRQLIKSVRRKIPDFVSAKMRIIWSF